MDPLVFYWIVLHPLVETVAPGCFDDTRGEDLKMDVIRVDSRACQMSGGNSQDPSNAVFNSGRERMVRGNG